MRVIEHSFSELLREPKTVVSDLDEGDVLLRRRGVPALRLHHRSASGLIGLVT